MVTTSSSGKLVVVGAGQAGAAAAVMLRQSGYGGSITLLGDELHLPYRRPPLSKAYLRGSANFESLRLWPDSHYKRLQIALYLGTLVEGIDRGAKHVITSEGNFDYDTLILATGSRARKLSIADVSLRGVLELRSLDDANALHINATKYTPGPHWWRLRRARISGDSTLARGRGGVARARRQATRSRRQRALGAFLRGIPSRSWSSYCMRS
jgi:NAD(P)H-nitrite reductase large subunit